MCLRHVLGPDFVEIKSSFEIVTLTVTEETDTDTEKSTFYDFMSFGDSSVVCNPLKQ